MNFFAEHSLIYFIVTFMLLILISILYFNIKYNYWKVRNVTYVKPQMLFGNFKDNLVGDTSVIDILDQIYKELREKKVRFGGYFEMHIPKLMILDPSLAQKIIVKDFSYFHDRSMFPIDEKYDPLTNNLSSLEGKKWRLLRYKLSPVFSTGKLRGMFDQIYNSGEDFLKELQKYVDKREPFDASVVSSIFTSDVIASCGFGLQFKVNSPQGEIYKQMIKKAFQPSRFILLRSMIRMVYTSLSRVLKIRTFSKEVTEYFLQLSKETVKYRKQNQIKRNDFLQLLLDLKEKEENYNSTTNSTQSQVDQEIEEENEDDKIINQLKYSSFYEDELIETKLMTEECLAASTFLFLVAGAEVSTAISFVLYSLACHPQAQVSLQAELDLVLKRHGGYSYQAIKELHYMDQVIQESFRLRPIGGYLSRVCTIPYRIPDSDVVIEKGTSVVIPIWSMHKDPEYYPNPEEFDPGRFPDNNFRPSSTFLPFGDGPRFCIAMRFAVLQMKVGLAMMLSRFSVGLSSRTSQPLQLDPHFLFPRVRGGVWLTIHNRTP